MAAIELFEFLLDGTYYRYTSGFVTLVKEEQDFTAEPIQRGSVANSDDLNRAGVRITAMRDNPFVVVLLASPQPATVTIFGELSGSTWATLWKGTIISLELQGAEAQIETESLLSGLHRTALYAKYQVLCRHVLYGEGCKVVKATYKFTGTVSGIDGVSVTIPGLDAQANDYYNGGYVKFESYDFRTIVDHAGDIITLFTAVPGLAVSDSADVYPGCNHTETQCTSKFSNLLNYGGFPWLPSGKNPFLSAKPRKRRR